MEDIFIPVELGKFQMCCIGDCTKDAADQRTVAGKFGAIYFTHCKEHAGTAKVLADKIDGHIARVRAMIKRKEINAEQVYIAPMGDEARFKANFIKYMDILKAKKKPAAPKKLEPQAPKHSTGIARMPSSFRWVQNYQKWKNLKGQLVPLSMLTEQELVSAILLIARENFEKPLHPEKLPPSLLWVEPLKQIAAGLVVQYCRGVLDVGPTVAHNKLEEFKKEYDRRSRK